MNIIKPIASNNRIALINNKHKSCYRFLQKLSIDDPRKILQKLINDPKKILQLEEWEDLQNKHILNENICISNFGDVHPFENPPIFKNVKNVFLHQNYKYFVYYWLDKKIFPNDPNIYLFGHPCNSEVVNRGFRLFLGYNKYYTAKIYAFEADYNHGITKEDNLIREIKDDDYYKILSSFVQEEVIMSNYDGNKNKFKELTEEDICLSNGTISKAIKNNAKW